MPTSVQPLTPPLAQPLVQKDGKLSHAWSRFFNDLWRKAGGTGNSAPITAENIYGLLASINQAANLQTNVTNYCTVDSIDNGSTATIRVYGTGGVGTSWTRLVGVASEGPYPAFSQAGFAYSTSYYVMYQPSTASYIITTNYVDTLADELVWAGAPTTVASGGGGGTTSGGGSIGTWDGCTEVGTPLHFDGITDSTQINLEECEDWIDLRFTPDEQPLRLHPETLVGVWMQARHLQSGQLIDLGDNGEFLPLCSATPNKKKSHKQVLKVFPHRAYRAGSRKVKLHNRKAIYI